MRKVKKERKEESESGVHEVRAFLKYSKEGGRRVYGDPYAVVMKIRWWLLAAILTHGIR